MKKRFLSLLFALTLALSLCAPAMAEGYEVEFSNINGDLASNDPSEYRLFSIKADVDPILVEKVTTYHWNNGLGTDKAGKICIIEYQKVNGEWKQLQVCGTWQATGRNYWGLENVYWDAYPDFVMMPGHAYVVKPVDESTWSYNAGSNNQGMVELYGNHLPNFNDSGTQDSGSGTSGLGYRCSSWAREGVQQAAFIGILPESLYNADLTQPITRAEFASVSVKTFVRMTKFPVDPSSNNPFTDTRDPDVLRAYALGITSGTSATTFSPNEKLTREMGATMLARAYKRMIYPGYTIAKDSEFPLSYDRPAFFDDDASISTYAMQSVYFMYNNDILNGMGNNLFGPKKTMTREQALLVAVRMVDNLTVAQ